MGARELQGQKGGCFVVLGRKAPGRGKWGLLLVSFSHMNPLITGEAEWRGAVQVAFN